MKGKEQEWCGHVRAERKVTELIGMCKSAVEMVIVDSLVKWLFVPRMK